MKPIEEMTLEELEEALNRFWNHPKVEQGKAQVPYFYSKEDNDMLNRCMKRRLELHNMKKKMNMRR